MKKSTNKRIISSSRHSNKKKNIKRVIALLICIFLLTGLWWVFYPPKGIAKSRLNAEALKRWPSNVGVKNISCLFCNEGEYFADAGGGQQIKVSDDTSTSWYDSLESVKWWGEADDLSGLQIVALLSSKLCYLNRSDDLNRLGNTIYAGMYSQEINDFLLEYYMYPRVK